MKYEVKFSCGHTHEIQIYGKNSEREKKIAYFEKYGVCPDCYREQKEIEKAAGCEEIEMSYREYKNNYAECNTKAGSYDGQKKTIIVYVPRK